MDETTVNSAWADVVHSQMDFERRQHWIHQVRRDEVDTYHGAMLTVSPNPQSSPTHFQYAEIWGSVSSPAGVKARLESEHGAKGCFHLTLDAHPDANNQWKDDQAKIDPFLNLLPLAWIILKRGSSIIERTRLYLAQLKREGRCWNEDARKLAFSAAVFLRYGFFLLKDTRQALAMVST